MKRKIDRSNINKYYDLFVNVLKKKAIHVSEVQQYLNISESLAFSLMKIMANKLDLFYCRGVLYLDPILSRKLKERIVVV
ncbi:MAG: hypothetical protein DRO01_00125 [Thermoproteota archaeon]|nr:MAG: hypothetical protein DRO01_00125 [Candidatus Korarchaeota archaeon]